MVATLTGLLSLNVFMKLALLGIAGGLFTVAIKLKAE